MKRAAVVVLLLALLQNLLQETEGYSSVVSEAPDDLRQLRYMVYQQGNQLTELKLKVKLLEGENADLKTKFQKKTKQEKEILKQLKELSKDVSAQSSEITVMRTALAGSEDAVKKWVKANKVMKKELSTTGDAVKSLKKEVIEKPKVAFSAGLTTSVGPLSSQSVLIYSKVFTNIGEAYNPNTGVFTAPVAGVYYFRFSVCGMTNGQYTGVSLYKNQQRLTQLFEYNNDGYARHFSGGITVELDKGDTVDGRLPSSYKLYDDSYNRNIFSGFLIFPVTSS